MFLLGFTTERLSNKFIGLVRIYPENFMNNDKPEHSNTNLKLYQCPECGLYYKEKEWEEKCEAWCKKYKSCNLEIINHSVEPHNINNNK